MSAPNKIRATHLERTAIIYVRQSTPAQVRDNPESRARQYALVEEAAQLGWSASKIEVIDADLGISGRSAERRSGFREVVSRVCLGEVGAIFGLEVSRLARSNADFARLLELARLTDTLVIDTDGMYDLREFNDRLLLGLKGAMSEAELYILAGRLQGAKRAAAERGELRFPLPVGYVRDADGCTIIDPDQEVTAAVADVFAAFQATGSAYGVVGAFINRRFPTVADRIAQTVVRLYLEPKVEPVFHPDSYGYRLGRSALQAVGVCRERCWRSDWVIDLDIRAFFDSVPHDLVLRAVRRHTDERWILLYVERWLKAPLQQEDGTLVQRDRGTPQGSSISPLLANLFLHYAFDVWMGKRFPDVPFERYCDDGVVHCTTEKQALSVRDAIARRLADCGLDLHPDKTRIVYCKDANRRAIYANERFDFLGYTFRARSAVGKTGKVFASFQPAVSSDALAEMSQKLRSWRINRRTNKTLDDLAQLVNVVVQGWINYYGRFYQTGLYPLLSRIDNYVVRWAKGKYKRLHGHTRRAKRWLVRVARREPTLFAHWRLGVLPKGWAMGAE